MAPGRLRRPGRHAAAAAPGAGTEKEEGPAEEAPEENRPSDLEPLSGYAEQGRRRMQIFELDGYLRLRADYMHQFFLGQGYYTVADSDVPGDPATGCRPSRCRSTARGRRRTAPIDPDAASAAQLRSRTSAARTCASASSRRST